MVDDDELALSASTLAALLEFKQNQEEETKKFEMLKNAAELDFANDFKEDWNLSQFWYSKETSTELAKIVTKNSQEGARVALISCPSIYFSLVQLNSNLKLKLLEVDNRLDKFNDFVFYDFNSPLALPADFQHSFDFLCIDPPFLSKECWAKFIETAKYLMKPNAKILACTGLIMKEFVEEELNVKQNEFEIIHHNGLSNEFGCFTNFEI